jgi:fatty-acyl-CoA synthase
MGEKGGARDMLAPVLTQSYWPADTREPILDTTVGGILRTAVEQAPDAPALIEGTPDGASSRRRWTYAELLQESERAARALLGRFEPGERVAIWAPNLPEWVVLEFGAALAGLTLVTVNPAYRSQELGYVLRQSRASGLFLVPEYRANSLLGFLEAARPQLPELRETVLLTDWAAFCASGSATEKLPDVHPEDSAQIQYTSGTTGFPKGAVLSHRSITNNARISAQCWEAAAGDVWVNPMPLFHTAGCVLLTLGPVQMLASQVLLPYFDPGLQLELIESERATLLLAVPTMLIAMLEHPDLQRRDLSSVRITVSGGATVLPDVVDSIEARLGAPLAIIYGQTESSPLITSIRPDDAHEDRASTLGQAAPQTEIKIVDPVTGATVPVDAVGEICTRGYLVMQGYFENPEATAAAIDAEGWLHTGDLGSMDSRGFCRIEGRLKEMIIRGGENIYPREIEQLLFSHPSVGNVAIVGVPDRKWGEQVAAFVRPAPGQTPTADELFAFCREHLAAHKTPRYWEFVDQLPLTPSGKIQKFVLREQFVARAAVAPSD